MSRHFPKFKIKADTVSNGLMVIIQFFTVWVLWLTYTNTVIPSRQKELLAEQVAQLEMARDAASKQISASEKSLKKLAKKSADQVSQIQDLETYKKSLSKEVRSARLAADQADRTSSQARNRLAETRRQLRLAEADIFHDQALLVLFRFGNNDRVEQINDSLRDDRDNTIADAILRAKSSWPSFSSISSETEKQLSEMNSNLYPRAFGTDFASFFKVRISTFSCVAPDFSVIESRYKEKLDKVDRAAEGEVLKEETSIIVKGKAKGVRYVIDPTSHKESVALRKSLDRIVVLGDLDTELFDLRMSCFDSYYDAGKSILDDYVKVLTRPHT